MDQLNGMYNSLFKKPLYQQLKDDIRVKIEKNEYQYGQQIPSEQQLIQEYGMSRITVRRALDELSSEGYLLKIQGKGTYASKPKLKKKIENIQSFTRACKMQGMTASHKLIERSLLIPNKEQRKFLRLSEKDKVIYTNRTLLADDQPVMKEHCFFPYNRQFAFMLDEPLERSLYDVLHEHDIYPTSSSETTLEAVGASIETASQLNVPVGEPMFYIVAFLTNDNNEPLFIEHSYMVGNRYMYRVKQ